MASKVKWCCPTFKYNMERPDKRGGPGPLAVLASTAAVLSACWTGDVTKQPAHPDEFTAPAPPMRAVRPHTDPPAPPPDWPTRVRTELTDLVSGPIVLLDLANGTVTTLCGDAADAAAADWQRRFAGWVSAPTCQTLTSPWSVDCFIVDHNTMLHVIVEDEDAPRLTGAADGVPRSVTGIKGLLSQFQQQRFVASCP